MLGILKHRRRARIAAQPFPEAWVDILSRNFRLYRRLPAPDRLELHGKTLVFLAEKDFEACGGLVMSDEIRVTIAAQACLLLLHRKTDYYPGLSSVLVYPRAFLVDDRQVLEPDLVREGGEDVRRGESWSRGNVILSWEDVLAGGRGFNVVLHEFAHQLDTEDGDVDGAPWLGERGQASRWAAVLGEHYRELRETVARRRSTLLDEYAATSPAEFFAVATEVFFEKALRLRREHPDLYQELARYYNQDPAGWY
ncbi:zinc-dependent peptidase [bacterium]|nr:zinc-dependent peptidase [bacterium]